MAGPSVAAVPPSARRAIATRPAHANRMQVARIAARVPSAAPTRPVDALAATLARSVADRAARFTVPTADGPLLQRGIWDCLTGLFSSCYPSAGQHEPLDEEDDLDDAVIIPVRPRGETLAVGQERSAVGAVGDTVVNLGTTSCALVLGFGESGKVAIFHWPGLVASRSYSAIFRAVTDQVKPVKAIEIITNVPMGSTTDKLHYVKTANMIRAEYGVPTRYFYMDCGGRDQDPRGLLEDDRLVPDLYPFIEVSLDHTDEIVTRGTRQVRGR